MPVDAHATVPRVSALMVTRGRAEMALRAVQCFNAQHYAAAELVIVDDDPRPDLQALIEQHCSTAQRARIRHVRLPDARAPLGALRNHAVALARGELICQWDDDDLHDPWRIATQVAVLDRVGAAGCSLSRHQMLWPRLRRLCLSVRRVWEGSLLAHKAALQAYPELPRGEDSPVVEALVAQGRYVLIDAPWLYTYIVHGHNTFDPQHFEPHWRKATERFEGAALERRLAALVAALPGPVGRSLLASLAPPEGPDGAHIEPGRSTSCGDAT